MLLTGTSPRQLYRSNDSLEPHPWVPFHPYPIPAAAAWSLLASSSISHSRCSLWALLCNVNLPVCSSHSAASPGYFRDSCAKSPRVRSAIGAITLQTSSLFSSRDNKVERVPVSFVLSRSCTVATARWVRAFGTEIQPSLHSLSELASVQTPDACVGPYRSCG
jgi:hypothetical protein